MNRIQQKSLALCCALLIPLVLFAQADSGKSAKTSPMHSLEWLVGGVWTADASMMGNGMKAIETRYTKSDNDVFLRFNTHFISDKGVQKQYDGNFYFDPAKNSLAMWYTSADNTIYAGPIKVEGNVSTFDFRAEDFSGKMADLRVLLTRKSDSLYNWALSEREGETWKPLASLDYLRKPEAKSTAQVGEPPAAMQQLRANAKEKNMGAVTGFGGAFIRTKDPKKLYAWYLEHLGLPGEHGSFNFAAENQRGPMVLSFFSQTSDYFPTTQPAMLNFQVDDLEAIRKKLIAAGVNVDPKVMEESYGKFGWFTDPEGNRVELWQPL